jgi:dTMP kinase
VFITFEGPEGGGKSTLIKRIAVELEASDFRVVVTREPGSGDFGRAIRQLILDGETIPPYAELFLFLADRANHVEKVIRPALDSQQVVLCDRHADSTIVYQGHARGLELEFLRLANLRATQGLRPDLIFLLDLDPAIGLARQSDQDRLDREPLEFHQKVRDGFLKEAAADTDRWYLINAAQDPEEVFRTAWAAVASYLNI